MHISISLHLFTQPALTKLCQKWVPYIYYYIIKYYCSLLLFSFLLNLCSTYCTCIVLANYYMYLHPKLYTHTYILYMLILYLHLYKYMLFFLSLYINSLCSHPKLTDILKCTSSSIVTTPTTCYIPLAVQNTRQLITLPKRYSELIKMAAEFK